jgi:hypothetical protein
LAGKHVNGASILLTETGLWWFAAVAPPQDIDMMLTSADVRQLALIYSIWSSTPDSLAVTNNNGRVALALRALTEGDVWEEGTVLGNVDLVAGKVRRRAVVTRVLAGEHLRVSPTEGTGEVMVGLAMFTDYNINAFIVNLNNAIMRTEAPYVFTEFPQSRVSSANFMAAIPNLSPDTSYKLIIWGLFLGVGVELDAPVVACSVLPTPTVEGVAVEAAAGFPVTMGTIPAGTAVYLVECAMEVPADGLAKGQLLYELSVDNPEAPIKLLGSGIRLTLKAE